MISLFNLNHYIIDTSKFSHYLHGEIVDLFVNSFCEYVGAKYGCAVNSATNAIFLALENKGETISIPSLIPPVVANAVKLSGNDLRFHDGVDWVGNSYVLHDFKSYKVIDSAQKVGKYQFFEEANDEDLMIFSFYPTKPVGGMDGGIIVSNDKEKIEYYKQKSFNGMKFAENNWEREIVSTGWKMYMNSAQAHIALQNLIKLEDKKNNLERVRNSYNEAFNIHNSSDHLYRISVDNRDEVMRRLKKEGIMTGVHYAALHKHPVYDTGQHLPQSELAAQKTLSIPFHEELTDEEVKKIICSITQ